MSTELFDEDTLPRDVVRALGGLDVGHPVRNDTRVTDWGAATRCGAMHDHNEDAWGQRDGRVFVLADGMGGRPAGDTAALAAVSSLLDRLAGTPGPVDWQRVMAAANEATAGAGRRIGHDRVGAAVAVVRTDRGRTSILHAGDVRAYRLRTTRPEPLTVDHTVANELDRSGLDPASVPGARRRLAALTCFLGGTDSWRGFGVRSLDVHPGDRLVLCSDGAHRHLAAADWERATSLASAQASAELLVDAAMRRSGRDDTTVVAVVLGDRP